jgi:hypothetical protein
MRTQSHHVTAMTLLLATVRRTRIVAFLLLILPSAALAQGTEIIRGKITGADGKPIPEASVTITGLSTQEVKTAKSNDKGIYTALFTNAEGDYLVSIRKIGYGPYNTRLTRTGLSTVLIADAVLKDIALELDTITALSRRAMPKGDEMSIGGFEQNLLTGALFSLDPTDLVALAAQIPGILSLGDSAFSVLGADASGNNTTVDGAKFGGGRLPQDAVAGSRVIQTSADPRVAGFTGGQTATILRGGTDIFAATARINFADSHLAWTDPAWPNPIPRNMGFSGGFGGPIIKKKLHYYASWTVTDNQSDVFSLLAPPNAVVSQYGLTLDTLAAVASTLNALGVPLSIAGLPDDRQTYFYNTNIVLDWTPKATTALRVTENGNWSISGAPGSAPYSYPTMGSKNSGTFQFLSARLTGYIHGFLDELSSSYNYSHNQSQPYAELPSANVRIGTVFDSGITGLTSLQFGGGGGVNLSTSHDWDTQNEFSWIPPNSKHRVKIGQDIDYSWSSNFSAGNQFGSYSYLTLADLAANDPASYSLTLGSLERSSQGATAALWVGDEWNVSKAVNIQTGLRYDAAFPETVPTYNPAVDQAFGLHTDQIPHSRLLTPRLGFSWASPKRRNMGATTSAGNNPVNLAGLPAGLSPEFIQALLGTPRGSVAPGWGINGSIGGYGGTVPNSSIANLIDQTGLPNTRRQLTCVGAATPIPNWSDINGAAPTSCLDGTGPATFSTNVPTVQVYDPSYKAPLTWRANLGIDGIRLPSKWTLGITTFASVGVNGQSFLDKNLNSTPQFFLANEGNRPVYVPPSDIVPETGVIAPGAYRINQDYGSVRDVVSDLHNYTTQFQAAFAPPHALLNNKLNLTITYVLNRTEQESRGFGGGGGGGDRIFFGPGGGGVFSGGGGGGFTAGNPFQTYWAPGTQPTHQINVTAAFRVWWFNVNTRINLLSGTHFTPSVAGDVNGDGLNDDVAFVPNPATTSDTGLASQMKQLLASTTGSARDCLLQQLGKTAAVSSCTTGWQARLDLAINWNPPRSFGWGDRLRLTTTMQNTSGALVRLFGLDNTPLGRSLLSTSANGQLLYVTGFDPATQSYKYQVNQLFGQPVNYGSARRRYPPFQLQLGLQYQLGGPDRTPMAHSMGLIPGAKEPPYTADQIRDKLQRLSRDPVQPILVRKDSIALTPDQVTKLAAISKQFRAQSDSALEPVFDYVMKKGRSIDDQELGSRLNKATPQVQRMLVDANARARALLTPAQLRMIPAAAPTPGAARPPAPGPGAAGAAATPPGGTVVKVVGGGGGE